MYRSMPMTRRKSSWRTRISGASNEAGTEARPAGQWDRGEVAGPADCPDRDGHGARPTGHWHPLCLWERHPCPPGLRPRQTLPGAERCPRSRAERDR
jgi:hypothetical protein